MNPPVRLEHLASQPLAVIRRRAAAGQLSTVVPAACGTVWSALRALNICGAGRHVALYWDDQINLEVGVEFDAPFPGHGEVVASATPAGPVAVAVHFGPYQLLGQAHDAICHWCAAHGRTPAGPCWEIYGHWLEQWNTDPSQVRTDVYHLLVPDHALGAADA